MKRPSILAVTALCIMMAGLAQSCYADDSELDSILDGKPPQSGPAPTSIQEQPALPANNTEQPDNDSQPSLKGPLPTSQETIPDNNDSEEKADLKPAIPQKVPASAMRQSNFNDEAKHHRSLFGKRSEVKTNKNDGADQPPAKANTNQNQLPQRQTATSVLPAATPVRADGLANSVPNFQLVTPFITRGGQPDAAALAKLKAAGVTTIVNLRNEPVLIQQEAQQARALQLRFINIPLDVFNPPSEASIRQFLQVMDNAPVGPVYVHCLHGQDRTGTLVAIYRIERQGWTTEQAYQEMLHQGFHPGFSRLTEAVFVHGAKAGKGAPMPVGSTIVDDIYSHFKHGQ